MEFMASVFERAGAFLLGRFAYDTFAAHWPRVNDPNDPVATKLNTLPKYMVSKTPQKLSWHNSTQLTGDLGRASAALKGTTNKELRVHGSAGLVQTLIQHDLIDEYNRLTFPVVLGQGRRLFGTGAMPATMKLLSQRTTKNGISIATYAHAGSLQTGSFALDA